jgi:hypothetical protein
MVFRAGSGLAVAFFCTNTVFYFPRIYSGACHRCQCERDFPPADPGMNPGEGDIFEGGCFVAGVAMSGALPYPNQNNIGRSRQNTQHLPPDERAARIPGSAGGWEPGWIPLRRAPEQVRGKVMFIGGS